MSSASTLLVCLALVASAAAIDNSLGLLPPMGWRSWNCFGGDIDQDKMQQTMDAMAARDRTVDGKPTSLLDLGYKNCGLDDNWQKCEKVHAQNSFHDTNGNPIVDSSKFPSMSAMTAYGHKLGLRVGWYMNNCICRESQFKGDMVTKIMEQSAKAVAAYGFDGVKLDGCSEFRNLTWWAGLLNATGRPILIENCHWGGTVPGQTTGDGPCTGVTPVSDCPYNFFRSSGDIRNNWGSMFGNLQTTTKFQGFPPLARPGAWAYPDMLEVGRMASFNEDRSHFGAWCIVSSPLVLGCDVRDNTTMDKIWPIVSNQEALAVSQSWAGHPGRLAASEGNGMAVGAPLALQTWTKPVSADAIAVLVINGKLTTGDTTIQFSTVNITGTVKVRDIWNHKDLGTATTSFKTDPVESHDSRFYLFTKA